MVLALQLYDVYGKSTLRFASQQALASTRVALVSPTLASQWCSVLPGFAPAAEVAPWRVPKGATFRLVGPVGHNICVEAKGPKTIDAPSGLIGGDGRHLEEGGPTRSESHKARRLI